MTTSIEPTPAGVPDATAARAADPGAEGYAVLFARRYLTWSAAQPQLTAQALEPFLGAGMEAAAGVVLPASGEQHVEWAEVVQERDWLLRHVTELTGQQERGEARPWLVSDAPPAFIDVMLRGIVGFRFPIARLEGKWKMSQNREMRDRVAVVTGLRERGEGEDLAVADEVAQRTGSAG